MGWSPERGELRLPTCPTPFHFVSDGDRIHSGRAGNERRSTDCSISSGSFCISFSVSKADIYGSQAVCGVSKASGQATCRIWRRVFAPIIEYQAKCLFQMPYLGSRDYRCHGRCYYHGGVNWMDPASCARVIKLWGISRLFRRFGSRTSAFPGRDKLTFRWPFYDTCGVGIELGRNRKSSRPSTLQWIQSTGSEWDLKAITYYQADRARKRAAWRAGEFYYMLLLLYYGRKRGNIQQYHENNPEWEQQQQH